MNIKGLRAFKQIMATGTLSAAAKSMNISDSALSRQLSLLETELGLVLFSRQKRRLIPTDEGEQFFREAERVLDSIEQIPEIVREIKSGTRRRMRIISMPRMASSIAVPAITQFLNEQDGLEVTLEVQPRRFMERWVASRKFDLGLGALPVHHSGIQTEKIYSVPVVAVLHPKHPLASRKSLRIDELAHERFITMTPNTLLGQQVSEMFDRASLKPASTIQVSQAILCCNFVAHGQGISITDAMIPVAFGSAVKMVPIEPRVHMDFGLLYPLGDRQSAEAKRLAEIIRSKATTYVARL
jgi:DNA-binding transcriptional LysR family regulator